MQYDDCFFYYFPRAYVVLYAKSKLQKPILLPSGALIDGKQDFARADIVIIIMDPNASIM